MKDFRLSVRESNTGYSSAEVRAGMSSLPGDPIWHVSSCSGEAGLHYQLANRYTAFTLLTFYEKGHFWGSY